MSADVCKLRELLVDLEAALTTLQKGVAGLASVVKDLEPKPSHLGCLHQTIGPVDERVLRVEDGSRGPEAPLHLGGDRLRMERVAMVQVKSLPILESQLQLATKGLPWFGSFRPRGTVVLRFPQLQATGPARAVTQLVGDVLRQQRMQRSSVRGDN